jgi:hypothetical protein
MKGFAIALVIVAGACGGGSSPDDPDAAGGDDTPPPDAREDPPDAPPAFVDHDLDGLDDGDELAWAVAYRPFLSVADDDGCALGGIVLRVFPHPDDPTLVAIIYDHLFETDCGFGGHTGDNEVFGATIDPAQPPPTGLVALVAASHQNTICERISACGRCPGLDACDTAMLDGVPTPVVYSSKDKHGTYATLSSCDPFATCFDACSLASASDDPPMVNAGEPTMHMIDDLTAQGFITAANGWTREEVFDHDPWGPDDFGGAGNIAEDLVDPTFVAAACH